MVWGLLVYDSPTAIAVQVGLFALFVLFSALISAAEASLISVPVFPRRQIEQLGEEGGTLQSLLSRPNRVLVTVLLGNYLANVAAAVTAVSLSIALLGTTSLSALLIAVLVATLVLLVLGEFVPRAIATVSPDRTARAVAPVLAAIQTLLFPAVWALERFSSQAMRMFGAPLQRRMFLDEEELKQMVRMGQAQGIIEKEEQEMISAVIDFADLAAGDIMVPRTDMVAVEDGTRVAEIISTIRQTGYSRIPVYHDDLDTVVGVVYGKDLLGEKHDVDETTAKDVMKQALFVPETAHLDEVLREMKTRRIHIAIVHDEYGGTAGLLSLEDVLEEIVGDIFDEYDPEADPIEWVDDRTVLLDARLDINEVNQALGTDLPQAAPYETLGGYLFHKLGRPGRSGEVVERPDVTFQIQRVANRRILKVQAMLHPDDHEPGQDGEPSPGELIPDPESEED